MIPLPIRDSDASGAVAGASLGFASGTCSSESGDAGLGISTISESTTPPASASVSFSDRNSDSVSFRTGVGPTDSFSAGEVLSSGLLIVWSLPCWFKGGSVESFGFDEYEAIVSGSIGVAAGL